MKIKEIGPITLKRVPATPNKFEPDAEPQPELIVAHVAVAAFDAAETDIFSPMQYDFLTRLNITDAAALGIAECEQLVARNLAQELRAVADALDGWSPAD